MFCASSLKYRDGISTSGIHESSVGICTRTGNSAGVDVADVPDADADGDTGSAGG
jgi:hypothetical protein